MKAAILAILLLVPHAAVAITAAAFIEHGRKSVEASGTTAEAARTRLFDLMALHPDIQVGALIKTTRTPSEVLPIYDIGLDALKTFTKASNATDVLKPTGRAYWHVYYRPQSSLDDRVTLSSVELQQTPAGWQTVRMGGASYAQSVWDTLETHHHPQEAILVRIPALALHFIGFVQEGQLVLSLIAGSPDFKIKERKAQRAEEVLLMLVPDAESHNGRYN